MKILVTGGTGFTGSYVVPRLLREGTQVRCLVRATSITRGLPLDQIELVEGDFAATASLDRAFDGCSALVNIASLGFGDAPAIVDAAVRAGIRRAVFVSTTAIFTTLDASSKAVRLAAEDAVRRSGLGYTILRPTMIYGSARDRNICRLIRYLRRWRVIPVFGSGQYLQQPVYVEDVADAIVQSLFSERAAGKVYNLPGGTPLTYNQIIDALCGLLRRRVCKIHLPAQAVAGSLALLEKLPLPVPLRREQVLRLNEHKAFSFAEAAEDFGYSARSFADGATQELRALGLMA